MMPDGALLANEGAIRSLRHRLWSTRSCCRERIVLPVSAIPAIGAQCVADCLAHDRNFRQQDSWAQGGV